MAHHQKREREREKRATTAIQLLLFVVKMAANNNGDHYRLSSLQNVGKKTAGKKLCAHMREREKKLLLKTLHFQKFKVLGRRNEKGLEQKSGAMINH